MSVSPALPLAGVTVLDVSRMLPGAVLARSLVDLGARVIKIEDPRSGDLMRLAPPQVGGIGVGFCVYYRGTESVGLDLRTRTGWRR
jgi:alpha-methylacyl-CoA racemase